jgi:metal-responsive CopG/Arc/MetJ family transcriptional regulator
MLTSAVSLTFPKEMLAKIDESRGDVSRSRYVLRIIEKFYKDDDNDVQGQCQGKH